MATQKYAIWKYVTVFEDTDGAVHEMEHDHYVEAAAFRKKIERFGCYIIRTSSYLAGWSD